ncbi:MAG: RHS repeat-associated core domain-containing protein, partial [Gemmatimonadaceae bacterium]
DWGEFPYTRPGQATHTWQGTVLVDKPDATGTYYRRNRSYDPNTARFTQEDPLGLAGGLNVYGFNGGDPVNFSDPFGLFVADGDPPTGPPPVPVPNGGKDNGWKWNPNPNNKRGGIWGPKIPIPNQSQPSASLEEAKGKGIKHWDVDNGLGDRERYDENGNPISADEAHGKVPRSNNSSGDSKPQGEGVVNKISKMTGLTGGALVLYLVVSEGSRIFPPRDLVPVP